MKRTSLKRVGARGKANIAANKLIRQEIQDRDMPNSCEMSLVGCLRGMFLTIAHKHKRAWYKGNLDLLSDYQEWVIACTNCHNLQEHDKELTEDIFNRLRP